MKKLKLYGEIKWFFVLRREGFVADVFVDKDNLVVVESKHLKLKKDLSHSLQQLIKHGELVLRKGITKGDIHMTVGSYQKPGDSNFLEALKSYHSFWWNKKFGGYEINNLASKIVEE